MNGSEKQVKWAEDIKTDVMAKMEAHREMLAARFVRRNLDESNPRRIEQTADFDACMTFFAAQTEAKWWIDNMRSADVDDMFVSTWAMRARRAAKAQHDRQARRVGRRKTGGGAQAPTYLQAG